MREKLDNYKNVKKLLYFAKQTFLSDKGMEIIPSLENLEVFKQELDKIIDLVYNMRDDLENAIQGKSEN